MLTFYGVGGQGKTHLCRHLSRMLGSNPSEIGQNLRWGVIDLHKHIEQQPEFILLWVRNALKAKSRVAFPAFDYAFELFWKEAHPSQPLPAIENPWWDEFRENADRAIVDTVPLVLEHVPFLGSILGRLGRVALDLGRDEVLRRSNKTLEHLYPDGKLLSAREIELRLPFILARDLDDWRADNPNDRFVVMIDEYESALEAGGAGSLFRPNEFDDTVRDLVAQCHATLFVYFSREKLRWDAADRAWAAVLDGRQHLLGGLSKSDADLFLNLAHVDDDDIRAAMIEGASALDPASDTITCYPIMLDMEIELYRRLSAAGATVAADLFRIDGENVTAKRHELLSRLLRRYPVQLEHTLRRLSVARRFDEQIYRFLISKFLIGQPADAWNDVRALSLVQKGATEGVYVFHNVMREGLLATLEPEAVMATHRALFEYFEPAMKPHPGKKIGAGQAAAAAEAFYHKEAIESKAVYLWWSDARRAFRGLAIDRFVEDIDRANAALAAKVYGEASLEHAKGLYWLERNLDAQSRYEDAANLYRRALDLFERGGTGTTLMAADVRSSLGIALDYQKKHSEAEGLLRQALNIRLGILQPNDLGVAISLAALGTNLGHQSRYPEAEQLIRKALEIVGVDEPSAPTIFQNLGVCLGNQERLVEAEEMHSSALALNERLFGPEDHRTGISLSYLGFILSRQHLFARAEPIIWRALEIANASYGQDHPRTAGCYQALGQTLYDQGRFEEAVQPGRQALAIRERIFGPAHPDTAASVGYLVRTLCRAGKKEEGLTYLQRAFQIRETILGPDHPDTKISAKQLLEAQSASASP